MLILIILIDVQYSKKAAFSFEKGLNHQKHSLGFLHTVKKIPPVKFPISPPPPPPMGGRIYNTPTPYYYLENPVSVIEHYYMCMFSVKDQSTNYKGNWYTKAYSTNWYYARGLQWSASNKCWNSLQIFWFSYGKQLFSASVFGLQLRLHYWRFLLLVEIIYWAVFFLKEINHWLIVFSLPTFIFCKNMYFRNDESGFLEIREISLFLCPTTVGKEIFVKFFL